MLHEVYAPRDGASVVWSRQKKTAFARLLCDMRDGVRLPCVVLLYGPTGSAKLSSVVAMLREHVDAKGNPTHVEVRHSCETSPQEYYGFLMDTFVERRGDGSVGAVARVVKFYGELPYSNLHALTARFLDQYKNYLHDEDTSHRGGPVRGPMLLRVNLVLFIVTTHDSHSDKVALGNSLPQRVLGHSVLHQFHCTPLTTRNITACVKQILRLEQQQRQEAQKQSQKNRAAETLLSDERVEHLCEQSHGDIRHALLQVQWHALIGPSTSGPPRRGPPRKRQRNVLDLLDDEPPSELQDSNPARISAGESGGSPFRDEYIDVAHATARILTQKYATSSVAAELNVEPRKLLGYLANNMPAYFNPAQMDACAACAAAASAADGLRAVGDPAGERRRGGPALHTARRTADDGGDGDGTIRLDAMALAIFGHAYRAHHKEVCIPRRFLPQRPPPYVDFAYPRVRDCPQPAFESALASTGRYYSSSSLRRSDADVGATSRDFAQPLARFANEAEWARDFMRRLEVERSPMAEADVVRESLPALVDRCAAVEGVLLEYVPYARWIVLNRLPPHKVHGPKTEIISDTELALQSSSQPSGVLPGPKKTLFSFAGSSHRGTRQGTKVKRSCSQLRYRILCQGVEGRPSVRAEHFTLSHADIEAEGCGVTELPWIPDGEDIEEFSD